jgi:hypothetical protein
VNGLDEEYAERLEVDVYDYGTAESQAKIKEYGFENHGLVMFDSEGTLQKKMDGHDWTEDQIRAALAEVMGGT